MPGQLTRQMCMCAYVRIRAHSAVMLPNSVGLDPHRAPRPHSAGMPPAQHAAMCRLRLSLCAAQRRSSATRQSRGMPGSTWERSPCTGSWCPCHGSGRRCSGSGSCPWLSLQQERSQAGSPQPRTQSHLRGTCSTCQSLLMPTRCAPTGWPAGPTPRSMDSWAAGRTQLGRTQLGGHAHTHKDAGVHAPGSRSLACSAPGCGDGFHAGGGVALRNALQAAVDAVYQRHCRSSAELSAAAGASHAAGCRLC